MNKESIKFIKSLASRGARNSSQLFVVEGVKLCEEMLKSGLKIEQIFFTEKLSFEHITLFSGVKSEKISPNSMSRISNLKSPTPILALVKMVELKSCELNENGLNLLLDSIQDPGNLGTIIRTCDWFGIRKIFCSPDTVDLYNQKVIQSTMGAISRVELYYCELKTLLNDAKENKMPIFSTDLNGENIYNEKLPSKAVIIMGNEGNGVSDEIKKFATKKILIPSYSENNICESLNVAVATAIVCAEFRRR